MRELLVKVGRELTCVDDDFRSIRNKYYYIMGRKGMFFPSFSGESEYNRFKKLGKYRVKPVVAIKA